MDQKLDAKTELAKKEGFAKFMDQPMTRLIMSMIPAGDKQEVLETLLRATFAEGYGKGLTDGMGEVLTMVLKPPKDGQKDAQRVA